MNEKKYNFCIVTYEASPNPITQNLKTFLLQNYDCDLLYIFHPMAEIKDGKQMSSSLDLFKENKLAESRKAYNWQAYWPLLYIKDVLYTFYWCLKLGKIDVYFAAGNLNPLVGIVLREFGIVKKVIYQSMDYYPTRFPNKFFDWLYFQLDKFCVKFADETWNANPIMVEAREKKMGMKREFYPKQYTVPGGVWFYKTKRLPFNKINRKKIVYRGWLLNHMGVDLAIKAMSLILKRDSKVQLEILGGGDEENNLKQLAHKLGISKNITFYGWIKDRAILDKLLSDGAVGIATFNTDILDEKIKNADPGKVKDYMLFGMPVITTGALSYSNQIMENKCGVVIPYKVEELSDTILKLLKNEKLLKEYRENALKFVKSFDWDHILRPNVSRVLR